LDNLHILFHQLLWVSFISNNVRYFLAEIKVLELLFNSGDHSIEFRLDKGKRKSAVIVVVDISGIAIEFELRGFVILLDFVLEFIYRNVPITQVLHTVNLIGPRSEKVY